MTEIMTRWVLPSLAGLIFVCLPFAWCRRRGIPEERYGLTWTLTRRAFVECAAATAVILGMLTVVSMNWPFEELPRASSLRRTAELAMTGVSAAIIEEIFFRGWLYPLIRSRAGVLIAMIATSAIFAAAHIFVAQTPFLFAVFFPALVMAALRERHGNIATSTIFHAVANIWAIWFAPSVWPDLSWITTRLFGG